MGGIDVILLVSRQGKVRLSKFYEHEHLDKKARQKFVREVSTLVLSRPPNFCNFIDYSSATSSSLANKKIVYKRYASLYFITLIGQDENELLTLEKIHLFVEALDRYFGNVCELDIIFNFHKAYFLLDEIFIGGELQETNKSEILRAMNMQDDIAEAEEEKDSKKITMNNINKLLR